jgi:hypothetical protein
VKKPPVKVAFLQQIKLHEDKIRINYWNSERIQFTLKSFGLFKQTILFDFDDSYVELTLKQQNSTREYNFIQ